MLLDRFSQTYNPRRKQTFTNPAGYQYYYINEVNGIEYYGFINVSDN